MSLINDALKRAKQAQLDAPRPTISGLHLRPVEPSQGLRQRIGLMLPAITLVAITLAALVGWRVFLKSNPAKSPSRISPAPASDLAARPAEELVAKAAPAVNEAQPQPASAPSAGVEFPAAVPGSSTPASTPGTLPGATIPSTPDGAVADSPVPAETPPAPKTAPLKLQGILFDPAHPAAMISGRTLFIGEKLGEWRVVSISQESATLVNAGQTNFLALPQ
jgi:hypothetical protein